MGLGRLSGSLARVVKNLLNHLVKLEAIVLGGLLLGLFGLGLTLVLSLRSHVLQADALVVRCAILVVYHRDRGIELVEVYVVASRVTWRWIRSPFRLLRGLFGGSVILCGKVLRPIFLLHKVLQEHLLVLVLSVIQRVAVARHFLDTSGDVVLDVDLLPVVLVRLDNFDRKRVVQNASRRGFALGMAWRRLEGRCVGLEDDVLPSQSDALLDLLLLLMNGCEGTLRLVVLN